MLGLVFSTLTAPHATAEPSDSVHTCVIFDHEQWRTDHPLPAAKLAAELNVGNPRTIRMIYFLPNDRPFRQEVVDSIKVRIRQSQTFFVEQMESLGHGRLNLRIETDSRGEPLVHRVDGQYPDSHYLDNTHVVYDEIDLAYDLGRNIYLVVVDHSINAIGLGGGRRAGGTGGRRGKSGGNALVPGSLNFEIVAHELGHAFGLLHDFHDGTYMMSYGPGRSRLSACHAEFLAVHPYFDLNSPVEFEEKDLLPTIRLASPRAYPAGSQSVTIQADVGDSDGLHQVLLFVRTLSPHFAAGSLEVKACRSLDGQRETLVEFEYDGRVPSAVSSNLSDPVVHSIRVTAVDLEGDSRSSGFLVAEISARRLAVLEDHRSSVNSVAFSPNGMVLASGSSDRTIKVWHAETSTQIADLKGHPGKVNSVAFSPNGVLLASGASDGTIKVWDLARRSEVSTLEGHEGSVTSVALTTRNDRLVLASGSLDSTVNIWDVETRSRVTALEGHASRVGSVAFSPDGVLLASGSWDGKVFLWDVAKGEPTATQAAHSRDVRSVAFSPDGAILASGASDRNVILWDVESGEKIETLKGHGSAVNSVSFSNDGALLVTSGWDGTVRLWDVFGREEIAVMGHTAAISSVSFGSNGRFLVTGGWDGKVILWDVSEWAGPRPAALEIISGDGQQGVSGNVLDQPLIVEVLDQYGNPLPQASVTFTVTAGEGKLSGRFAVERVTTDAGGRAELPLTLGPIPGPNVVVVSIGGRQLGTFTAVGAGSTVAELEGDYRTWHLPTPATVRLGKGAMGEGDRAVAVSPDGRCLAVASAIGVWLYETSTSRSLALLSTASPVHSVAFSVSSTLASGLDNGTVELWDVQTGASIGTLRHADWGRVTAVDFSPDGTRLASGSRDQVIKLWDVAARRETGKWEVPREDNALWSLSAAFTPDGRRLASGFQDGTVRLWDVVSRTEVAMLEGHTDRVTSVSFSPDGSLLASAGAWNDRTVRLWDTRTKLETATLAGHTGGVSTVIFSSPDGKTLASGSRDGTVRLWDVTTLDPIVTLDEHAGSVVSVVYSPDGATLVSGATTGRVLLRELESGNAARMSGHGSMTSMALSSDGVTLALGYRDGTIQLWDAVRRARLATLEGHTSGVETVTFSSDGATLASGSWDRTVRIWDVMTQEPAGTLEGHSRGVTSVAFSPDGATLASAGGWRDATVRLWDPASREPIGTLEGHSNEVLSVSFSSDGARLATGGGYEDKTVRIWNVATRELIGTLEGHSGSVRAVAFSPDDALLASGSRDGVTLWDVGSRQRKFSLNNRRSVNSLAFSTDGNTLATGTWGGVTLWDVETREQIATLEGHTRSVHSVALSDDGAILATGGGDGTMLLWDIKGYIAPSIPNPDFDGDGTVGFPDFLRFAAQFGLSQGAEGYDARFDLDGNGAIGFSDFLIFAGAFGKSTV